MDNRKLSLRVNGQTSKPRDQTTGRGRVGDQEVGVLTVDDQAVFRRAARDVIEATVGFEPVGEAASGEEALAMVDEIDPELILMDVRMPGIDGLEAARRISAAHPAVTIVLITIEDPDEVAASPQSCGAVALMRKQDFGPATLRAVWDQHGARVPSEPEPD